MKYEICPMCGGDGALEVLRGDETVRRETCAGCFGRGEVRVHRCSDCTGNGFRVQARKLDGTHVLVKCGTCKGTGDPKKEAA